MDRPTYAHIRSFFTKIDSGAYFFYITDPHHLVSSFITALEKLATQNNAEMKLKFFEVGTVIKIKQCKILEELKQRHDRAETVMDFVDDCIVESEEQDLHTQFLQMQKNQLMDLQEHFERFCNVLLVLGINSANFELNLFKSYLLPIFFNEPDIKPTVLKKENQFVPFNFGDIQ